MKWDTITQKGRLKGLYRDNCMEDIRGGIRYVIWGLENQYVPDRTTPFKVMGYNYTAYDRLKSLLSTIKRMKSILMWNSFCQDKR